MTDQVAELQKQVANLQERVTRLEKDRERKAVESVMDDTGLRAAREAEHAPTTDRRSARSPRIEVITRGERRRAWAMEQKREIVLESLQPDVRPADVARRHGINTGLLYTWRRQMLEGQSVNGCVATAELCARRADAIACRSRPDAPDGKRCSASADSADAWRRDRDRTARAE